MGNENELLVETYNGSKTRSYLNHDGFPCFEHTNTQGDRVEVKAKGNCLEITPSSSNCRMKTNGNEEMAVILVWLESC
jgi:hypothetical protein